MLHMGSPDECDACMGHRVALVHSDGSQKTPRASRERGAANKAIITSVAEKRGIGGMLSHFARVGALRRGSLAFLHCDHVAGLEFGSGIPQSLYVTYTFIGSDASVGAFHFPHRIPLRRVVGLPEMYRPSTAAIEEKIRGVRGSAN